MEDGSDYEKAVSLIGTAGVASAPIAIDLEEVLANRMNIRRIGYSEVSGLLEIIEARKAEGEGTSKEMVQKRVERGKQFFGKEVSEAGKELGKVEEILGKELGGSAMVNSAARELEAVAKSVETEFEEFVRRNMGKPKASGLVLPRLSLPDQLSELEQISAGLDRGTFNAGQRKTIVSEIVGLDAVASKEGARFISDDVNGLADLRSRRIRDIKGKLNIK